MYRGFRVLASITPAENIVKIAEDNVILSFWKSQNGLLINGVSFAIEEEAKLYAPIMLKIVRKYERLWDKKRKMFNVFEHGVVNDEFYSVYTKIKLGSLDFNEYLLRGI